MCTTDVTYEGGRARGMMPHGLNHRTQQLPDSAGTTVEGTPVYFRTGANARERARRNAQEAGAQQHQVRAHQVCVGNLPMSVAQSNEGCASTCTQFNEVNVMVETGKLGLAVAPCGVIIP